MQMQPLVKHLQEGLDVHSLQKVEPCPMNPVREFTCVPAVFGGVGDICPDQATWKTG